MIVVLPFLTLGYACELWTIFLDPIFDTKMQPTTNSQPYMVLDIRNYTVKLLLALGEFMVVEIKGMFLKFKKSL